MEESFRVRIDKVFGSLSSTTAAPSPSLDSLWCLTDDEIDRNDRSGEKKEVPENDREDSNVDEEEVGSSVLEKPEDYNEEEWEIKSSIGMDTTLDMEEEEDENDKVAVGEEELCVEYTNDVNDYEPEADDWVEIPPYFGERDKDPRANCVAAEIRLKEDADAVNKLNSLHVSEDNTSEKEKALGVSDEEGYVGIADDNGLKPILKRKESQADSKLQKRVRFSSDVKDDDSTGGDEDSAMETSVVQRENPSVVPDYVRNPSKYTRYTFDDGEVDEESNRKAYMEFLNMIRSRDEPVEDPLVELPTSVAFVPKRKPTGESKVGCTDKGYEGRRGAIAIVDSIEDSTVSAMEEDEPETAVTVVRRPGRQYRARAKEDEEE
ncbi:Protein TSSC4 [Hirschfeldia incana]|nr:Protein TSSC4 [Hirschfeldia incana]